MRHVRVDRDRRRCGSASTPLPAVGAVGRRRPRRGCRRPSRPDQELFGAHRRGARRRRLRPRRLGAASCGRTSAATTPSTRSSAACCSTARCPATDLGLYVSGRAGFEIVQKAWAAGFGAVVVGERAVGARGRGGPPGGHDPGRLRARRRAAIRQRLQPRTARRLMGWREQLTGWRPRGWVSWRPNGAGLQKPHHYRDMAKVAWANRAHPKYAVRRAHEGRVRRLRARRRRAARLDHRRRAPLHDPPQPARAEHRRRRSTPCCSPTSRRSTGRTSAQLRRLGRLAHPMRRRRGEPGFRRIAWAEALDAARRRASARTTPTASRSTSRAAASRTRPTTSPARRRGPWASPASTRRRARLPRPVDGRAQAVDRRRRRPRARSRTSSRATSWCCGAPTRPTTSRCS